MHQASERVHSTHPASIRDVSSDCCEVCTKKYELFFQELPLLEEKLLLNAPRELFLRTQAPLPRRQTDDADRRRADVYNDTSDETRLSRPIPGTPRIGPAVPWSTHEIQRCMNSMKLVGNSRRRTAAARLVTSMPY